jgi:predicted HAD superfamily Cof-like phosphohydrolase
MKEPQALTMVSEFHTLFDAPILDTPQMPDEKRAQLRVSLLQEELNELQEAIDNNDLTEVADALADLQYVLSGAVLEFGLADRFADIFAEVQRSNMSKACNTLQEAEATVEHYKTTK